MLETLPRPVIIAHRGASAYAPENTISAFKLALVQGADAIELDVQLTSDKRVVVIHDAILDRTTSGTGKVKDHNLASLQSFNAGHAYGPEFSGEKIPTLEEVFDIFGTDTLFNIEIKNSCMPSSVLSFMVIDLVKKFKMDDKVIVSSFNPIVLNKIVKVMPDLWKGLLIYGSSQIAMIKFFPFLVNNYQSIHLPFSKITPSTVNLFQKQSKLVFAYTINHPRDILFARDCGVDGFFTDDPALARRALEQ